MCAYELAAQWEADLPAEVPLTFEAVYQRHAGDVYRFCLFLLHDPTTAEDVAGDVFVSALAAYQRDEPVANVRAWLIRIAKNAVINHQRRAGRWRKVLAVFTQEQKPPASVEATAVVNEQMRELLEAMKVLRPRQRLLVSLRYASDLSYDEIGAATGMSAKAAAMATYRAVERLRSHAGGLSL